MRSIILMAIVCLAGFAGAAQPNVPTSVTATPPLADMKRKFETDMRDLQKQQREEFKVLRQAYTDSLTKLEGPLQEKGEMQTLITIRDEKARFEQAGEIPAGALVSEPATLRKAQDEWNAQAQQAFVAHAKKIVALSEKYMQQLALLQKSLTGPNDQAELAAVKDETERLLGNNMIREALALAKTAKPAELAEKPAVTNTPAPAIKPEPAVVTSLTAPLEVGDYKFYPPGKEPPAKELKSLRLEFPNVERKSSANFFTLASSVYFDKNKLQVDRRNFNDSSSREEQGFVRSIPRITIAIRNRDLPEGCKLVIQYFSRSTIRSSELHEERAEHIGLPPLGRGQSVVVDGQGISLYKFEYRDVRVYLRNRMGREFYGLILSIFDTDGKLLIQQCTPSSLIKSCQATLPAAKDQDPVQPGRNAN